MENKTCAVCGDDKPLDDFAWKSKTQRRNRCKGCDSDRSARRRKDRRAKQFEALSNQKCELCGGVDRLVIDHDHATGYVRGVLCTPCNVAIGSFRDDPALMIKAAEYVRTPRQLGLYWKLHLSQNSLGA